MIWPDDAAPVRYPGQARPTPFKLDQDGPVVTSRGVATVGGKFFLSCWHAEYDTLPWIERRLDDPSLVDVVLPFGVKSDIGEVPDCAIAVTIGGSHRTYTTHDGGGIHPLTPSTVARRVRHAEKLRGEPGVLEKRHHYVDVAQAAADDEGKAFFRLVVERVPRDAVVRYTITARTPLLRTVGKAVTVAFQLRASAPEFGPDDLCATGGVADTADDHIDGRARWALLHQRDEAKGLDHIRLDLLSAIDGNPTNRPAVSLTVGNAPPVQADASWAGRPAGDFVPIPLIDREIDSILISTPVPADGSRPVVQVGTGVPEADAEVDLGKRVPPVQLMIINYCIQGLNDLFAVPDDKYDPPRTYMQVTMCDERGSWSSRPGSAEDGDADGYALTLDAHRYYGVPSMWAFNAGVLTMIAHDCPDDLRRIQDDVRSGLLVPVNAGFGAHRPPYYTADTNREEISRGRAVINAFLPDPKAEGLGVYYPDQRLYKATDGETAVYKDNGLVTHLVLDRSTLCYAPAAGPQQQFWALPDFAANRVLSDPATGCRILPIEDAVRNLIIAGGDDRVRGKASFGLRSLLLRALRYGADHDDPVLLVYGDDADKASGCGWFDGDYTGRPIHFNEGYQATLCWLSRHPWVRVVTVRDERVKQAQAAPLRAPLASATCPSVDPGGAATVDRYGNDLHFDTWKNQWADWPSLWLGKSLEKLSDRIETALRGWPKADDWLIDLAWMTFLGLHHEMMWNKEPLENDQVNKRLGVLSPEDFVVAASLQLRNAQVYLAAALWSDWARSTPVTGTHVNDGDLIDQLVTLGRAGARGLHWDGDLLPNDILYNNEVLAVCDRNGGRVTHLFAIDHQSDHALCLSGTPKAFQWTGPVRGRDEWLTCDGGVLENTVLTPNHLYVASDLHEARPRLGWRYEDRPRQRSPRRWLYPDTFNEYLAEPLPAAGAVRYRCGPPAGQQPGAMVLEKVFADACDADRSARTPGGNPNNSVIWRDDDVTTFTKTIALAGRRLTVHYENVAPGHLVGNEFSVDLRAGLTGAGFQQKWSGAQGRGVILMGPHGGRVSLTAATNCELTPASLLPDLATARVRKSAKDYLRLHRVLTDAVEIVCRHGGTFEYVVDIG